MNEKKNVAKQLELCVTVEPILQAFLSLWMIDSMF